MVVGDEIFAMCISQFVVLVEAEGIIFPVFEKYLRQWDSSCCMKVSAIIRYFSTWGEPGSNKLTSPSKDLIIIRLLSHPQPRFQTNLLVMRATYPDREFDQPRFSLEWLRLPGWKERASCSRWCRLPMRLPAYCYSWRLELVTCAMQMRYRYEFIWEKRKRCGFNQQLQNPFLLPSYIVLQGQAAVKRYLSSSKLPHPWRVGRLQSFGRSRLCTLLWAVRCFCW